MRVGRAFVVSLALLLGLIGVAVGWLYATRGAFGLDAVFRRGGAYWVELPADDARLSPAMRLALQAAIPQAVAGEFVWSEPEPGFEVAEMPVRAAGREIDRILLNRIDPRRYRFVVRNVIGRDIDEWERAAPEAALIVNGSYFDLRGRPDTPVVSQGAALGPRDYDARAGAFVSDADGVRLVDLAQRDWKPALAGARDAMVSYPQLIGADGGLRAGPESRWLSNRTFLGQDSAGRLIVGTTREAFFSLARLGAFLKQAPLDLRLALNLDGGPVACQSVRLNGYTRKFYARWESQYRDGRALLLTPVLRGAVAAMPVALIVERRRLDEPL